MMRNLKYTAAFAAAVMFAVLPTACTDDPAEQAEPTPLPQSGDLPVCWDVKGVESPSNATRVMIGDDETGETGGTGGTTTRPTNPAHPEFYIKLKEVCTVPASGSREDGFAIGLFGDYTYTENGNTITEYDFFRGNRLVYLPPETTPEDKKTPTGWDTNAAQKYWHPGAEYIFRAYYPQRLYNYTISTSNATTLALVYPSRKLQYDLLLAVTPVDTNDATWSGSDPVDLKFQHALAALRFKFKLNFDDADFLTSVYLLNDEEQHYFSQGTVVYGAEIDEKTDKTDADILKKRQSIKWLQDYNPPADEILYKWVPPLKYWYGIDEDEAGVKDGVFVEKSADEMLEYWGWNKANPLQSLSQIPIEFPTDLGSTGSTGSTGGTGSEEGKVYGYNPVLMYSLSKTISTQADGIEYHGKEANTYYGTEQYYDIGAKKWITLDPTKPNEAEEIAAEGTLYCRNSGWLLIPPQQSYGTLTLCFSTKKGGKTLYKVKLPQHTGSKVNAMDENGNVLKDENGNAIQKDGWAAGYRYTYLVTISESNLAINVSIDPWNERKHSTEIIF